MDVNTPLIIRWVLLSGIAAITYGAVLTALVLRSPSGDSKMQEIAKSIQEGAAAYLNKQYSVVALVGIVIFLILWFIVGKPATAAGFALGAVASTLAGYIGMNVAVRANVRAAQAAKLGLASALGLRFRGGAVTGLMVWGLGLVCVNL